MDEPLRPPPDEPLPRPESWHPFRHNRLTDELTQAGTPFEMLIETYTKSWNLYHRLIHLSRKIQLTILLLSAFTSGGLLILISNDLPVLGAYIGSAVSFVVAGLMGYREIYKLDERIQTTLRTAKHLGKLLGHVRGAPEEVDQRKFWAELKDAEGDIRSS